MKVQQTNTSQMLVLVLQSVQAQTGVMLAMTTQLVLSLLLHQLQQM